MTKRVPYKSVLVASALLTLTAFTDSAWADWRDQIAPSDVERLAHLNDARGDALAQARARGGKGDYRAIENILGPEAHAVPEQALTGNWRCRQIKLGGLSGYYVFDWFNCRISKAGGGI